MADSKRTLHEQAKPLRVRFEAKRRVTIDSLNERTGQVKTTEKLCVEATRMQSDLNKEPSNASNQENEWKDIQTKLASTAVNGKVVLDVGGEMYSTSVETLTREKNTFFTALFSKQWQIKRDPVDKSIFIDRDGKLFHHILNYLRTGKIPIDTMDDESLRQSLINEAEYFRLQGFASLLMENKQEPRRRQLNFYVPHRALLRTKVQAKLNEFYGKKDQRWTLIYKASWDGFDGAAFHRRCDNQGPTMTIIRSNNNYLFGGYTAIPWTSNHAWKQDTTAFLFTLTNPHPIPPTKYLIDAAKSNHAVYHHATCGPTFGEGLGPLLPGPGRRRAPGSGHDLLVAGGSNANDSSCTYFPGVYIDATGMGEGTFTGAKNFTTSDIEVYKLC